MQCSLTQNDTVSYRSNPTAKLSVTLLSRRISGNSQQLPEVISGPAPNYWYLLSDAAAASGASSQLAIGDDRLDRYLPGRREKASGKRERLSPRVQFALQRSTNMSVAVDL